MHLSWTITAILFLSVTTAGLTTQQTDPSQNVKGKKNSKLIQMKNNFTIVEFIGEEVIFYDEILEKEMKERGVLIPPALRGLYSGKAAVRLGEAEFQRAFKDVFSLNIFDQRNYKWEE